MKQIIILLLSVFIISETFSQSWVQQNSGTGENINDIFFLNVNTGYAVGNGGVVVKTTNGGTNWLMPSANLPTSLTRVKFFDVNTGISLGASAVYKTTNGGVNWIQVANYNSSDASISEINTIYALGSSNPVKSTDKGDNWSNTGQTPPLTPTCIYFMNSNTGYAATTQFSAGPDFYYIVKTTNAGLNWNVLFSSPATPGASAVRRIVFSSEQKGFMIAKGGTTFERTTNGGANWSVVFGSSNFYGIYFISENTGWVCGNGAFVAKTSDGGASWYTPSMPVSVRLNCIQFADALTGWAAGQTGVILKSTDGGVTPIIQNSNVIPEKFSLLQNYPNPFNPTTNIKFDVSNSGFVKLTVFDVLGKAIQTLVNEQLSPGSYNYDFDASHLPSGIYYYKLEANGFTQTKKMILIK